METTQRDLHRRYGPVVRIAPNELSFASPAAARDIFTVGKGFHKTDFYSVFPPPENPDLFTEVNETVHASKKRTAATAYSMASILEMEPFIEATGKMLVTRLHEEFVSKNENSCDLGKWLHFYAFDVLGQVAFSKNFGFLEAGVDVDETIHGVEGTLSYFAIIGQIPEYHKLALGNPLLNLFLKPKGSLITEIAMREIQRRKKMAKREIMRRDLLNRLFTAAEEHPERFNEMDVFSIAHGAVFAGSDSTASTMQSTFYHVLRSPAVHAKLLAEIDDKFAAGQLSDPIQYSEAISMPYFQAVLKEAMRMRPGVGISMTRHVPEGGTHIDGQWYPGGTRVGVNAWVVHENKQVFGQDADIFRPERWLEADSKVMERHLYQVSSSSSMKILSRHFLSDYDGISSSAAAVISASAEISRLLK
jgi:cytochrome P450